MLYTMTLVEMHQRSADSGREDVVVVGVKHVALSRVVRMEHLFHSGASEEMTHFFYFDVREEAQEEREG